MYSKLAYIPSTLSGHKYSNTILLCIINNNKMGLLKAGNSFKPRQLLNSDIKFYTYTVELLSLEVF